MKVTFQIIDWYASDDDKGDNFVITMFGRTPDGESVAISTTFDPYFFVDMRSPGKPTPMDKTRFFQNLSTFCSPLKSSIHFKKCVRGFQNNEGRWFMKLDFDTLRNRGFARYALEKQDYSLYEADLDPLLRFMHRSNIKATGWVEVDERACSHTSDYRCDIQHHVADWRHIKAIEREEVAPFRIASFDIETYSHDGSFPDPQVPENVVFQIAITTQVYGSDDFMDKTCLCLKQTEGDNVQCFKTEGELLDAFARLMDQLDVDILTGWNIYGFDLRYIYERCIVTGCGGGLCLSKISGYECQLKTKKLTSSALGDNELHMLPMPGTFTFDLMQTVKSEKKLESYSLNAVAKKFVGDQKIDMSAREMFDRYREGDPQKLGEVAEYCIKDTELPHQIMKKLKTIPNLMEMASASCVPINFLTERGQQIKVFSLLTKTARESGFMIPTKKRSKDEPQQTKYQGATVLEAQSGAYYSPITALDFASLYPSIMMAHNLCYSTLVLDSRYDNIEGVTYEEFHVGRQTYRFAQDVPSLLPKMLNDLKAFRKQAKKDMARTKGTPLEAVYDGKQLAYKISMNSIYGFCGAMRGMFPCVPIASSVTYQGRRMIEMTKEYVEANYPGSKVRYGDSVTGDTPLVVRTTNGKIKIVAIQDLSQTWKENEGKESAELVGLETWTERGWTAVERVIRHKTKKRILRINTHCGAVDVTEDHSLVTGTGEAIKPKDVSIGDVLLTKPFDKTSQHGGGDGGCTVSTDEKIKAMELYFYYQSHGYDVSVDVDDDGRTYHISTGKLGKDPGLVKKIVDLGETEDFVYDLTTSNHHFQAGVGCLVVHNTDSVMVEFDTGGLEGMEAIEKSWELGAKAAQECTALFKKPNDLELEKVYCPFFLYTKKRYAAKMWTEQGGKVQFDCIDVKGLQMKKRDLPQYSREVCKEVLDCILESSNTEKPIQLARQRAIELLGGNVDPKKLYLSKSLKSHYKNPNQPHVHVVEKMRRRNPGSEPRSGDRVPFLIVHAEGSKIYEKAEDPTFVEENNVPIDYRYYFDNQFMRPVGDLLSALVETNYDIFSNLLSQKLLNRRAKEKYNSVEGVKDIRSFFSKYKKA